MEKGRGGAERSGLSWLVGTVVSNEYVIRQRFIFSGRNPEHSAPQPADTLVFAVPY